MSYIVENIERKGKIACYKQFLLFSQSFSQLYNISIVGQNTALCGNGLRSIGQDLNHDLKVKFCLLTWVNNPGHHAPFCFKIFSEIRASAARNLHQNVCFTFSYGFKFAVKWFELK